jgi:hypothetical protein
MMMTQTQVAVAAVRTNIPPLMKKIQVRRKTSSNIKKKKSKVLTQLIKLTTPW